MARKVRIAARVLGVALSLAAGLLSVSQVLGGPVSVVMVSGTSMRPDYRQGDLVLVRRAGSYQTGDVVAYRSRQLHAVVLHRIVARDGDGLVFKGDNNAWRDPEHPRMQDLVGAEWIRLPAIGLALGWLRTPSGIFAGIGVAALMTLGGFGVRRHRRRRRLRRAFPLSSVASEIVAPRQTRPASRAAAMGLAVIAALSITAGTAATLGARTSSNAFAYEHTGAFEYSASVPARGPYQTDRLETGDPVYLNVAKNVSVAFRYRFQTDADHRLGGRSRLALEITDDTGWKHTLRLQPETSFDGDEAIVRGRLDLKNVWHVIDRFQSLTGLQNASYTLTVVPTVRVDGTIGSQKFGDAFDARLAFRLDRLLLRLAGSAAEPAGTEATDPLHPRSQGTIDIASGARRSLLGLPSGFPWLAFAVGLAAMAGFALTMTRSQRYNRRDDEGAHILKRYRQWIVPIRGPLGTGDATMIEVTTIEGLLRLADRHGRMVLHADHDGRHAFLIEEERTIYRYRPKTPAGEDLESPAELGADQLRNPLATPAAWTEARDA